MEDIRLLCEECSPSLATDSRENGTSVLRMRCVGCGRSFSLAGGRAGDAFDDEPTLVLPIGRLFGEASDMRTFPAAAPAVESFAGDPGSMLAESPELEPPPPSSDPTLSAFGSSGTHPSHPFFPPVDGPAGTTRERTSAPACARARPPSALGRLALTSAIAVISALVAFTGARVVESIAQRSSRASDPVVAAASAASSASGVDDTFVFVPAEVDDPAVDGVRAESAEPGSEGRCLPQRKLESVINANRSSLARQCWERARTSRRSLRVSVAAGIDADGSVRRVAAVSDDGEVASCVESAVGQWRFPAGGCVQDVTFIVNFVR